MFNRKSLIVLLLTFIIVGCSTDDSFDVSKSETQSEKLPISFDSYLSRTKNTRGTPMEEPAALALNGGIGIFAMYTEGGKYDPESNNANDIKNYESNFMINSQLHTSLTNDSLEKADTTVVAGNWTYGPVRYWPNKDNAYVSFMAYAPYNAMYTSSYPMLSKDGTTTGDLTYLYHRMADDPRDQVDLMYSSGTNITNMQLLYKDGAWQKTGDFYDGADGDTWTVPRVKLNFKHATARIGFTVTSSALKDPRNYSHLYDNGHKSTFEEIIREGMTVDWYSQTSSDIKIDVNKVMFLGDNSSAEAENPTGAFYPFGTLDLTADKNSTDPWGSKGNGGTKMAFTYDNTDTSRTVYGIYRDGSNLVYDDLKGDKRGGWRIWIPNEGWYYDYEAIGYFLNAALSVSWEYTYNYWKRNLSDTAIRNYFYSYGLLEGTTDEDVENFLNSTLYQQWRKYMYGKTIDAEWWPDDETSTGLAKEPDIKSIGTRLNDYMFVIPQDFTGDDPLWIYLDYTVRYTNGVSGDVATNGINYKVYKQVKYDFKAGHAYIIAIDINGDGNQFNAIDFTVQSEAWPDEEKVGVNF